jgi:hypothetical protein
MSRYFSSIVILICTTSMLVGCASRPIRSTIVFSPDTHLIFNPEWTGIAIADTPRTAWPTTTTYQTSDEEIEFLETTIDIQGLYGFSSDRTYRRFESKRRGYHIR